MNAPRNWLSSLLGPASDRVAPAGHLKSVVILHGTRMHAVDLDIPRDHVVYGDVDLGVLWNAHHRSRNLELLATLAKCENPNARSPTTKTWMPQFRSAEKEPTGNR